jgi:Transglycosylase SLT domain
MRMLWLCALVLGINLHAPIGGADARVYGFVDLEGVSHFTDAPTTVRYRPLPALDPPRAVPVADGPYAEPINTAAATYRVDPGLITAIMRAESSFNRQAVSRKGARGLMQLMPGTADRYGVDNTFDPAENIRAGVRHLRSLLDHFPGHLRLVVAAYNAGETAVLKYRTVPPFAETRAYVRRVLEHYRQPPDPARAAPAAGPPPPLLPPVNLLPPPEVVGTLHAQIFRHVAPDGTATYSDRPPPAPAAGGAPR